MASWTEKNFDDLDQSEDSPEDVPNGADLGRRWQMDDGDAAVSLWGIIAEGYVSEWFVARTRGDVTETIEARNQDHAEGLAKGLRISWADELDREE